MRKKLVLITLALSLSLNLAFAATWAVRRFAAPGGGGQTAAREHEIWSPLHRRLGVGRSRWKKIEPRLREFQRKLGERHERIQKVRHGMLELLSAPEVDRNAIEKQQDRVLAAFRKTQDLVLSHVLTERKLLTPEQRKQFFRILRRRMEESGPGNPPIGRGTGGRGVGKALRGLEKRPGSGEQSTQ